MGKTHFLPIIAKRERAAALHSLSLHTMIGKCLIKLLSFHHKIIFLVKKLKIVKNYL